MTSNSEFLRPRYFRFHVDKWGNSTSVSLLSWEKRGIFLELLRKSWGDHECGLPENPEEMRMMIHATKAEWRRAETDMLKLFPPHPRVGGKRANPTLLDEWDRVTTKMASDRVAKAKGGKARWEKSRANAEQQHSMGGADAKQTVAKKRREENVSSSSLRSEELRGAVAPGPLGASGRCAEQQLPPDTPAVWESRAAVNRAAEVICEVIVDEAKQGPMIDVLLEWERQGKPIDCYDRAAAAIRTEPERTWDAAALEAMLGPEMPSPGADA